MINKTIIHGYLGRDPELKSFTKDGQERKLVNFSVGVGRDFGDETDWFDVTMFGARAEVIHKFFHKGSQIVVYGRMQSETVEKDGAKRKYWKLIANDFDFCDPRDSGSGQSNGASLPAADDIPDSWEQAEEDNPF